MRAAGEPHLLCSVPSSSSQQAGAPTLLAADRSLAASAMLRRWVVRIGPALGLIAIVLVFTLLTDAPERYLSAFNLRIVLSQTVITAIGAIGMTMIIVSGGDRKSTRLNSSHLVISYAVFCLKKKKTQ